MRFGKFTKPLPVCDFMTTALLIMGDGATVANFLFAFKPQV